MWAQHAICVCESTNTTQAMCTPRGVPSSIRTCLLRGLPLTKGCIQAREVFEKRMGQTLPQDAARRLSHGVNFYLSAVDNQLRHKDDQPSIGLLLCKEKDRLIGEYPMRDVKKPIGVAAWAARP